jgi:hypothetical protein
MTMAFLSTLSNRRNQFSVLNMSQIGIHLNIYLKDKLSGYFRAFGPLPSRRKNAFNPWLRKIKLSV